MLGFHQDEERSIEARAQIWEKLLHEEASEKRDYDAAVLAVKWGEHLAKYVTIMLFPKTIGPNRLTCIQRDRA